MIINSGWYMNVAELLILNNSVYTAHYSTYCGNSCVKHVLCILGTSDLQESLSSILAPV